jgi:hypothetical protein
MTKPNVDSATLLRVKKLLVHSESAAELGSVEEAASFAAKANEILLKHKLELSDVEFAAEQASNPVGVGPLLDPSSVCRGANPAGFRRRAAWTEWLASGIAEAHSCRFLVSDRTKAMWFVGRQSDRELAEYLFMVLVERGWNMAGKYYYAARKQAQEQGTKMPTKPKESFLLGFTLGVTEKLEAMKQKMMLSNSKALIRLKDPEVKKFMDEHYKDKKAEAAEVNIGDWVGFGVGRIAGGREQVNKAVPEKDTKQSTLGGVS